MKATAHRIHRLAVIASRTVRGYSDIGPWTALDRRTKAAYTTFARYVTITSRGYEALLRDHPTGDH